MSKGLPFLVAHPGRGFPRRAGRGGAGASPIASRFVGATRETGRDPQADEPRRAPRGSARAPDGAARGAMGDGNTPCIRSGRRPEPTGTSETDPTTAPTGRRGGTAPRRTSTRASSETIPRREVGPALECVLIGSEAPPAAGLPECVQNGLARRGTVSAIWTAVGIRGNVASGHEDLGDPIAAPSGRDDNPSAGRRSPCAKETP